MRKSKQQRDQNGSSSNGQSHSSVFDVDFVLEHNSAEHVYVCGDFNGWQPTCLRMIGDDEAGLWEKRLALPPGRYEYKFVVDGLWLHDPNCPRNVPNAFGSLNSIVKVPADIPPKGTV